MPDNQDKINLLHSKLEELLKKQDDFLKEINSLRVEISELKKGGVNELVKPEGVAQPEVIHKPDSPVVKEQDPSADFPRINQLKHKARQQAVPSVKPGFNVKSDLEKFIGENLISKIGIGITVIGVAIGAKYAIDHQLISPLTRIILGYLVGIILLGLAIQLKKQYENFSAVLLSGSMAILYFITYAAYSFYSLIPQAATFLLMTVFTAFTVVAAIKYNRQVIAHIGMVGAYAIPFLLSDGSGKVGVLFTYIAIINSGILIIAFKRYWKPLYYLSFTLTWLIYGFWYIFSYRESEHFGLALAFLFIYFVCFYLIFLAYKLFREEKFRFTDITSLLSNSFIFYGIGYAILKDHETGEQLLGLFTLFNAIIHSVVGLIIYRKKLADRNLFYLVFGLVLVFTTIAIPVQLDGNWVTLLWVGEAALLFWIGRTRQVTFYEILSLPLILLAFFSIIHDWTTQYFVYQPALPGTKIPPVFNIHFLSSLLVIAAFGFINFLHQKKTDPNRVQPFGRFTMWVSFFLATILLLTVYYAFRMEIETYWNQRLMSFVHTIEFRGDEVNSYYAGNHLVLYRTIWVINYSLLFVSALAFVNIGKIRNRLLGLFNIGLIIFSLGVFLTRGLYILSELRDHYLNPGPLLSNEGNAFSIGIRYVSYVLVALALYSFYRYLRKDFIKRDLRIVFDLVLHISVIWIMSSEIINWIDLAYSGSSSYKLELTILWGAYSLFLIILGIRQRKKHLRIGAISLFGITLIKLFFYDISHLDTIAKTIVFISLGVLLLIISFLYNKYKHVISDESNP